MTGLLTRILDGARHRVGLQLSLSALVCFLAPAILLAALGELERRVLSWVLYGVALAYLLTCLLMVVEANLAVRRRARERPAAPRDGWAPTVTMIVAAYLPNEQEIIEQTLRHLCHESGVPAERLQVLLAYNTPEDLPGIEGRLRTLAAATPQLDVLRVPGSTSKAQNIMGALPHARGEVTVILDADHHLEPGAADLAIRWLDAGYDVVQGRCVIRNARRNLLTRIVAAEFEVIYGISHAGRSLLTDTAIFGGANGWWRTDVLRALGVDHRMLTEDIDVSIRALLSGRRLVHERDIVSTELAPTTFAAWWKQRTRWAQGWFQVTLRHTADVRRSRVLSPAVRIYWLILLVWREMFPIVSLQIFTVLAAQALIGVPFGGIRDPFLITSTVVTVLSGVGLALAGAHVMSDTARRDLGWGWMLAYAVLTAPYTILRNAVAQAAMVREIVGDRRWMVTRRDQAVRRGSSPGDRPPDGGPRDGIRGGTARTEPVSPAAGGRSAKTT